MSIVQKMGMGDTNISSFSFLIEVLEFLLVKELFHTTIHSSLTLDTIFKCRFTVYIIYLMVILGCFTMFNNIAIS